MEINPIGTGICLAESASLETTLRYSQGDVLMVIKLDPLARSMADLVAITSKLGTKGFKL